MRSGNFKEMQRITSSFPFDSSNWTVWDWMLENTQGQRAILEKLSLHMCPIIIIIISDI